MFPRAIFRALERDKGRREMIEYGRNTFVKRWISTSLARTCTKGADAYLSSIRAASRRRRQIKRSNYIIS